MCFCVFLSPSELHALASSADSAPHLFPSSVLQTPLCSAASVHFFPSRPPSSRVSPMSQLTKTSSRFFFWPLKNGKKGHHVFLKRCRFSTVCGKKAGASDKGRGACVGDAKGLTGLKGRRKALEFLVVINVRSASTHLWKPSELWGACAAK